MDQNDSPLPQNNSPLDPSKTPLAPNNSPLVKVYYIVGIIGVIVAIIGTYHAIRKSDSSPIVINNSPVTKVSVEVPSVKPAQSGSNTVSRDSGTIAFSRSEKHPIHATIGSVPPTQLPGKKAYLGVRIKSAGQQWDNNLAARLTELLSAKGFMAMEADPAAKDSDFDKLISGDLSLSAPEETKGPFNTSKTEYTLTLLLQFYDGTGAPPCAKHIYHQLVSTDQSDTRDHIIRQGVTGLLAQLGNETTFPFCITSKSTAINK